MDDVEAKATLIQFITLFPFHPSICIADDVSSLLDADWLDQSNGRPTGQAGSGGRAALR